jgi:hypothetical protein
MMMRTHIAVLIAFILALPVAVRAHTHTEPGKSYRVVRDDAGVWWFESPAGERFYSLGVCNVSPEPYKPKPGTKFYDPVPTQFGGNVRAWGEHVRTLLLSHGFNTLGAWSSVHIPTDERLHITPVLYVVQNEGTRCLAPLRKDFEAFVEANLTEAIGKLPAREHILGVFLDNEMPWYGRSGWDDIPTYTLLEQAIELPQGDERRAGTLAFLKSRHASIAAFNDAWLLEVKSWEALTLADLRLSTSPAATADRLAFTEMLAERFYEHTTKRVRERLPGLLILGTRIPGNAPDPVIKACGKYCDVMSVNEYRTEPRASVTTLTRFWLLGGKPIMHTEFSWRGKDNASGNPNSRGAGAVLPAQADRAAAYSSLVEDIATVPYVIASHWFEFADQSPQGRFDGEDSNYGIVNIDNKPYVELLSAMKATNARVHTLHATTTRQMPKVLPELVGVQYSPGQHPARPPTLSLLAEWTQPPELWGAPDASMRWKRDGDALVLDYSAGESYGCGINIFPPKHPPADRDTRFVGDLDGYAFIVLTAKAPRGVQLNFVLAEAGAASSSAPGFDRSAGDDGEGFISPPFMGTGKVETYRLPIDRLIKQKFFGNQSGANRVDMQALRNTGVQVSGSPNKGEVRIERLALER